MCNSIKPYNDDLNSFDYNLKCVLKENKCQQVEKSGEEEYADKFGYREYYKCEDYKENVEKSICEAIIPYDYSLKCVYKDNQCVEEERFCTENDPIKTRYYKCEDFNNEDSSKICKLYNNKCIETYEKCEDYTENVNKDICESIISGNYPFADCVYKDNQCIINKRLL